MKGNYKWLQKYKNLWHPKYFVTYYQYHIVCPCDHYDFEEACKEGDSVLVNTNTFEEEFADVNCLILSVNEDEAKQAKEVAAVKEEAEYLYILVQKVIFAACIFCVVIIFAQSHDNLMKMTLV